jgi:hypothetical protein
MMQVRTASEPVPGQTANEDHVFQAGPLVGVLDGATVPEDFETGCVHGPAWYVRQLAARLALSVADRPMATLMGSLAAAILAVRGDHGDQCDLDHPGTPSAALCLLRATAEHVDYLVLCDSPLILDLGEEIRVISDDRLAASATDLRQTAEMMRVSQVVPDPVARMSQAVRLQRRRMNQTHGYWVAASNPDAAYHAISGTLPLHGPERVRRAALLTDGVTRLVDDFNLLDWRGVLDVLTVEGPVELLRRVRVAERDHPAAQRFSKRHDDATVAFCHFDVD